jgi:hypothetical protein
MTRTHKLLIAIFAGVVLLVGGTTYATYRAFTSHGLITVDVAEKSMAGGRVRLVLPGVLLHAGTCALRFAPEREIHQLRHELEDVVPMMEVVAEELEAMPDMTLVRVESEDEYVYVRKKDGQLVIDVETEGEDIHVSLPIGAVTDVVRALAGADL